MLINLPEWYTTKHDLYNWSFYMGTVVDNKDPKKLGRVKCSIEGLLNFDKEKLPWIMGNGSPKKRSVPEIGDQLIIIFPFKDIYHGMFLGHWSHTGNVNPDFDPDYPDTIGISEQGFKAVYNKKSKLFTLLHPSGSTLTINEAGDVSFIAKTKFDIKATGDASFTTDGKVKIDGKGGVDISSDAELKIFGKGKTTVGDAASQTIVMGQLVALGGEGGSPVALMGSQCLGLGNLGIPVVSTIITGASKVMAQ